MKQAAYLAGGLILGLALAALIGWVIFPVYRYDEGPGAMRRDYQEEYIRLTAVTYQLDDDLNAATERLETVGGATVLVSVTERYIKAERSDWLIAPLVELAYALEANTPAMADYYQE